MNNIHSPETSTKHIVLAFPFPAKVLIKVNTHFQSNHGDFSSLDKLFTELKLSFLTGISKNHPKSSSQPTSIRQFKISLILFKLTTFFTCSILQKHSKWACSTETVNYQGNTSAVRRFDHWRFEFILTQRLRMHSVRPANGSALSTVCDLQARYGTGKHPASAQLQCL